MWSGASVPSLCLLLLLWVREMAAGGLAALIGTKSPVLMEGDHSCAGLSLNGRRDTLLSVPVAFRPQGDGS